MSTVLITGAGSGIGKELANLFAERKYDLLLCGRTLEKLEDVQKEILSKYEINSTVIQYDLNNTENIEKIIGNYDADVLINCAGTGKIGDYESLSLEDEKRMINVNFVAPMILSKIFIKKFMVKKYGTIINVCSTASLYPNPYLNVYSASKVSLLYYSLALDKEISMKNNNIRVLSVCPGPVNTDFFKKDTREKFSSWKKYEMKVSKVAKAIMQAFDMKKRFTVIGFGNKIFSYIMRVLPISFQLKIVEKFLRKGV